METSLAKRPGVAAGLYAAKPALRSWLSGLADWLAERRVHPDTLTYAALGCALVGGVALAASGSTPVLAALIAPLAAARIALNALDGLVAERRGLARPWGQVLNELCDRLADVAFVGGLFFVPGAWAVVVGAALSAMLLSSSLGVLAAAAGGRRIYAGVMGKADRMLWLSLAGVATALTGQFLPLQLLPVLLALGAVVTVVQRVRIAHGQF